MEYTIIESRDRDILLETISGYIEKGWEPQGGICIYNTPINSFICYAQAMVRKKKV